MSVWNSVGAGGLSSLRLFATLGTCNQPLDRPDLPLQVAETHVSITVQVLTDLYPLIQCFLKFPSFPDEPPPRLVYGTGLWTDDNLSTALEFFFQRNTYHPQASCGKCGHPGDVPMTVLTNHAPIAPPLLDQASRGASTRGAGCWGGGTKAAWNSELLNVKPTFDTTDTTSNLWTSWSPKGSFRNELFPRALQSVTQSPLGNFLVF
jgi:hypothetical protein